MNDNQPIRWRMTRSAVWRILMAISILLVSYQLSKGQPPAASTGSEVEAEPQVTRSPAAQAVVNSLAARDPQAPDDVFQAVVILRQFEEYEQAKQFLARLSGLDTEQLAELYEQVGVGALVQLSTDVGMAPEGREFTSQVFQAVNEVRLDPARMQSSIEALASRSIVEKRKALATLAAAGAEAVPVLLSAVGDPPAGVTTRDLRQAMAAIGADSAPPLVAALNGPDPQLQIAAAEVLGYVASQENSLYLLRPFHAGEGEVQQTAASALNRLGFSSAGSAASAADFLRREALAYLNLKKPIAAEGKVELWTWDAQRNNVVRSELDGSAAAVVIASRLLRDAYELRPTHENSQLLLLSRLEGDQRLVGIDEKLPHGAGSAYQLGAEMGVAAVNEVFLQGLAKGLDAACIGACELLADFGTEAQVQGTTWSPLIRGLKSENRRVRHAAAKAVMTIDPRRPFSGSSYFLETLIDLANCQGVPTALLGSSRDDTSNVLSGMLASFSFDVDRGLNGKDFLRRAFRSSDYDLLLVSDAIHGPPASEVLQQLRQHERTKAVPVILLSRADGTEAAERLARRDPLVIVMPEFADEIALAATINRAQALTASKVAPPGLRLEHAADALQWLVHLAQFSQTYDWYDFSRAGDVAASAIFVEGLAPALDLLGYVGSESSQQVLVDAAGNLSLPLDRRQRAANAFTEAVLRHGLMLKAADVNRQYARYNASKAADASTQAIFAQVLDTIEARTRSEL
jgi:hypothetical protein